MGGYEGVKKARLANVGEDWVATAHRAPVPNLADVFLRPALADVLHLKTIQKRCFMRFAQILLFVAF